MVPDYRQFLMRTGGICAGQRPAGFTKCCTQEVRRGAQGASCVAPGKLGLDACGEGSASLLSSHGRGIRPLDALKDSQDLSRSWQEYLGSLDLCR